MSVARTVLITGCASGFGRALVTAYLARGWQVIGTMRDLAGRAAGFAEEARTGRLTLLELDVTSAEQRRSVAGYVATKLGGGLDCLVNNAGYGALGAFEDSSERQLRDQLEVNFFGLALLSHELLPALRARRGRIINVSSLLGFSAMPLNSLYCASKFAVEGLSEALYYELKPHGVQVALVEPGGFRTGFGERAVWAERSGDAASAYAAQTRGFRAFRARLMARPGNPPAAVAQAIVALAERRRMPLRVRCGGDSRFTYRLRRLLPERWLTSFYSSLFGRLFWKDEGESYGA